MSMDGLTPEEMVQVLRPVDKETILLKARIKELEAEGSPYVIGAKAVLLAHETEIDLLACQETMNSVIATSTPQLIAAAKAMDLPQFVLILGTVIKTFFIIGRLYQMGKYKENE